MKNLTVHALVFLLLLSSLYSCTKTPSPSPETKVPAVVQTSQPVSKADWQQKWDIVLAQAKKEGVVSIYHNWRPETRILLQAFREKFGISAEFTSFGRGAEIAPRVQAEKRAEIYESDLFGAGLGTLIVSMKPLGLLGPIKPLLILPEVLDQNAWIGGKLPFADDEGRAFRMIGVINPAIVYNTNLVKEGEITSYEDLLKPQYRGQITFNDPTVAGAGNAVVTNLGHNVWGQEKTVEFLKRLVKEQKVDIQRDNRLNLETVSKGKYAVTIGSLPDLTAEFMDAGAPIKMAKLKEADHITTAAGAIGVPTKFSHPNATMIFVNWLLSKEGQSLFARSFGGPSTRMDASTEGINPALVPSADKKYYPQTEDFLKVQGDWQTLAKQAIDEASK